MKRTLRRGLIILLALVFAGSLGMVIYRGIEYKEGQETYEEAAELVQLPDLSDLPEPTPEEPEESAPVYVDPYADALRNMDFAALQEVNSDVLGWILIPNTVISYPLVQGNNNQYYLNHTWKKWTSVVGAIFLECQNSPDFSDFNTVIYGHRMNNGSMFASLKNYKKQSYWASHPYYISRMTTAAISMRSLPPTRSRLLEPRIRSGFPAIRPSRRSLITAWGSPSLIPASRRRFTTRF